jgi:hypothetical protein
VAPAEVLLLLALLQGQGWVCGVAPGVLLAGLLAAWWVLGRWPRGWQGWRAHCAGWRAPQLRAACLEGSWVCRAGVPVLEGSLPPFEA